MSIEQTQGRTTIGLKVSTKEAFDAAIQEESTIGKVSADDFLRHLLAENGHEVPDQ